MTRLKDFLASHQPQVEAFATRLGRAFDDLAKFVGVLVGKIDWAAVRGMFSQIQAAAGDVAGSLGPAFIAALTSIPWSAVGDVFRIGATFARDALRLFTSAPDWVKAAVVTGWGLNKITGGNLANLLGDAGKGLFGTIGDQFFARGSSPANPMWVAGLGGPGGAGAAGGASLLGNLARVIIPVAIASITAEAALAISGLNDPRHRTPEGDIFRGTNVPGEQLAIQLDAAKRLRERIAGGERGFVEKQLAAVEAEIRRLQGMVAGPSPQRQPFAPTGPSPQRQPFAATDPRGIEAAAAQAAAMAKLHADLMAIFNNQGAATLRAADKAGTLDKSAGDLINLFKTSTNPSLKSMLANQEILKGLAAQGDPATRAALSGHITALQALIDRKLTALTAAMGWVDKWRGPDVVPGAPKLPTGGLRAGGRATGGPAPKGMPLIIGERRRPEVFIPAERGRIEPDVGRALGGPSEVHYHEHLTVEGDLRARDTNDVLTQLRRIARIGHGSGAVAVPAGG
jgi:hypothetical protein